MAIIGGILALVGAIGLLVFWIITLVKQFKSGQTVWGVLTIFFSVPLAPIWAFINGHKGLGIKFILALIVLIIGYALFFVGAFSQIQELQQQYQVQPQ